MIQLSDNPLLPYSQVRLANGFTLIHKAVHTAPILAIDIWIHTGAIHDPEPHYGLSHFFEHMFFKGTERHGTGEMDRIITSLGGYNNAATSLDYTHYYVVLPSVGWRHALEVLLDSLLNPLFDPQEIERERSVIIEEIKRHEDNPWSKIYDEFTQAAFARCPYQRQVLGSVESLGTIQRETFFQYHRERYAPHNITLCVVGDAAFDEVKDEIERLTASSKPDAPNAVPAGPLPEFDQIDASAEVVLRRDVNQSYLLLGYPTPRLTGLRQEYGLDALSSMLGDGRSSRLYRRLNDELGLVSSIGCTYWSLAHAGMFIIDAVTDPDKVDRVEEEIERELAKLWDTMNETELEKIKSMARADFAFSNEKVISVAHTYGYGSVIHQVEHAVYYLQHLLTVNLEEIRQSMETYIQPRRRCKGLLLPRS